MVDAAWACPRLAGGLLALALVAAGSAAVFAELTESLVAHDDLVLYDPLVTQVAVSSRRGWITPVAWFFTHVGGTIGLMSLTALLCTAFVVARKPRHAAGLAAVMAGSSLATVVLKLVVQRGRPSVSLLLGAPADTCSYPSGHSFNSAVLAGALAGFVLLTGVSRWMKAAAVVGAVAFAVAVGASRIYLAYHWHTDVLAGWALAVGWLSVCAMVLLVWRQRVRERAPLPAAQE